VIKMHLLIPGGVKSRLAMLMDTRVHSACSPSFALPGIKICDFYQYVVLTHYA
jgi:hypothetical protein